MRRTRENAQEMARRVRFMRAYKRLRQQDVAAHIGIGLQTYKRCEGGGYAFTMDEALAIAELCDVPEKFARQGVAAFDADLQRDRIAAEAMAPFIEEMRTSIRENFARLEERLRALETQNVIQ